MTWWSYRARWRGVEYTVNPDSGPDGLLLRLFGHEGGDGFEEVAPGVYVRAVPVTECEVFVYVTTVCEWSRLPCQVSASRGDELLLEYTGGRAPVARFHGFERIERGVYRRWVPREEVRALRENTLVLHPAEPDQALPG
ncbi:MAG TPA: hypothetical protein VGR21_07240 [Cryptosporangiaceae bacterium]|nr:hypothetical protein [Cryptosporangiaceae bacterium]